MNRDLIIASFGKLKTLLKGMDIPEYRRQDPSWLNRNIQVRNKEHPNYTAALQEIKFLLRSGAHTPPKD